MLRIVARSLKYPLTFCKTALFTQVALFNSLY